MRISRRRFTGLLAGAAVLPLAGSSPAFAQEKVLRIGYQKYGTLVLLKARGIFPQYAEAAVFLGANRWRAFRM